MTQILTAEQLAEKLSIHIDSVRKLTRDGTFPHHRIGPGAVRYCLEDVLARTAVNQHPDDDAIDRFVMVMRAHMEAGRVEGKDGWRDPTQYADAHLVAKLNQCMLHGKWADMANYAMMLHERGAR